MKKEIAKSVSEQIQKFAWGWDYSWCRWWWNNKVPAWLKKSREEKYKFYKSYFKEVLMIEPMRAKQGL